MDQMKSDFQASLDRLCSEKSREIWSIWMTMGCDAESIQSRCNTVMHYMSETFDEMIKEENASKDVIIKAIEAHCRNQFTLCKELGVPVEQPSNTLPMVEIEKVMREITQALSEKKAQRMEEVFKYKKQDEQLCLALSADPYYVSSKVLPTPEMFEGLKEHIRKLTALKEERFAVFSRCKEDIIDLMTRMECEPNSSFERLVVCEEDDTFQLSADNLSSVKAILERLKTKLQSQQDEAESLRKTIANIHGKLDLDADELKEFLAKFHDYSATTIRELQVKVDLLEDMKSQHMERFVEAARRELAEWWECCFYDQSQRDLFDPFYSKEYSEDLLNSHEAEIERIKSYYTKNKHLFSMVQQRQNLWKKKLALEARAKDPNRYHAKSTNFLKEEKDRKCVEKQLPRIEEELENAIQEYEIENNQVFLVGGIPYKAYMENQVTEHNQLLEMEKKEKADAKKQLLLLETRYGSRPVTPAKLNSTKRKATCTPGLEISKRAKPSSAMLSDNTMRLPPSRSSTMTRRGAAASKLADKSRLARKKLLRSGDSIIAGSAEIKTPAFGLSSINTDFSPFIRPQPQNFANSTLKQNPDTPLRRTRSQRALASAKPEPKLPSSKSLTSAVESSLKTLKTPTRRVLTPFNKNQKLKTTNKPFFL